MKRRNFLKRMGIGIGGASAIIPVIQNYGQVKGKIWGVKYYDKELSLDEIEALEGELFIVERHDGLGGYDRTVYPMSEGEGLLAHDTRSPIIEGRKGRLMSMEGVDDIIKIPCKLYKPKNI